MQIIIKYPDLLPDALQQTRTEFEREAKMAMAAKLFELGKLSSGMAAVLVEMGRVEFLLSLHRYGVAMINLDESELQADIENAWEIEQEMQLTVSLELDEDGIWIAECPSIPGCVSQGSTRDEAVENIKEAIQLCLEVRAEQGLSLR